MRRAERLITSAVLLAAHQTEIKEEFEDLMHDFDEEWLAVQMAAYAFHNHTRALAKCGERLYPVQERWFTSGRVDLALAIDPVLEAGEHDHSLFAMIFLTVLIRQSTYACHIFLRWHLL